MQVDNPVSSQPFSSFAPGSGASFEDFFNMDLLSGAGPSAGNRSTSRSPSTSYSTLPPTPPQPWNFPDTFGVDDVSDFDKFFNYLGDEQPAQLKTESMAQPPLSTAPYDFMSAFASMGASSSGTGSSHDSPSSGPSSVSAVSPAATAPAEQESRIFAIDPQLVDSPVTSKAMSEFDEDERLEREEDEEEEDDDEEGLMIRPVKVAGKGKARKGTVRSGGVKKSTAMSLKEKQGSKDIDNDNWRPSPEEYKKMSSKEKRQLRNKISARNFRVRRKEYITTLEGDVAERDRLIDMIRSELSSTKSENTALRQEITALKKSLLEGRAAGEPSPLPPPGPLPSPSQQPRSSSPLLTPNLQKDIPLSPRLASKAFWGGSQSFGGVTPVHTTLVPELPFTALSAKSLSGKPGEKELQENINPALNKREADRSLTPAAFNGFDAFADVNPFTMKTIDAYRMHLWSKMAQQQHAMAQAQHNANKNTGLTGLANNLRPHYFTSSAVLSGKAKNAYPTPPSSPPLSSTSAARPLGNSNSNSNKDMPTPQQAMLAAAASQTVLGRLGSAFWEAFSGSSGSGAGRVAGNWDQDKVRKVLEGKAVVKVVDVDEKQAVKKEAPILAPITVKKEEAPSPKLGPAMGSRCVDKCCFSTSLLEEGMKSLTIGRK